jgi:hypothetical protein
MTEFKSIDSQEIKERFPKLYREDAQYYSILKNGTNAGIYGIIDRGYSIAETFMTVFEGYKYLDLDKMAKLD